MLRHTVTHICKHSNAQDVLLSLTVGKYKDKLVFFCGKHKKSMDVADSSQKKGSGKPKNSMDVPKPQKKSMDADSSHNN